MALSDPKDDLRKALQSAREAIVWKLEGLSEYDVRRPLTPSGSNLLGLLKHLAGCEFGYFGETFDRPADDPLPWSEDDAEADADMWATPDESRADIVGLYRRSWAHADATFDALPLDAVGRVAWWGEYGEVTLHKIMVHMVAETQRHAGHADILRESVDGAVGRRPGDRNVVSADVAWKAAYFAKLEEAAKQAEA